jgi:hypothetical protein
LEVEKTLKEHRKILDIKVDFEEYQDLRALVLKLPKVEDFQTMKVFLDEAVTEFSTDNKQFHLDFAKHNEIIRRYDEVLNQKSSKMELKNV